MKTTRCFGVFPGLARRCAILALTATLVGCGESAPTGPSGPGSPSPPTPSPPTPPPPTGITLDVLRSQGGGRLLERQNPPFARATAEFDVRGQSAGGHAGRAFAEAVVSIGIAERPSAKSWVYADWSGQPGNYRVSTEVRWRGYLAGNGVLGTGAKVTYELEIRDFRGRLLTPSRTLHEREIRESALTIGGLLDEGSTSTAVDFTLPANTGGPFRIQFTLTCEAYSGALSGLAHCLFGNDPSLGPVDLTGFAEWTSLSVTEFR